MKYYVRTIKKKKIPAEPHIYYVREIISNNIFKYLIDSDNFHTAVVDKKNSMQKVLYLICLHEMIKGSGDKPINDMNKNELSKLLRLYGIKIVINSKLREQINKEEKEEPKIYWYQN